MTGNSPTVLLILDGWGHREDAPDNAISRANTPVWDAMWRDRPHCLIASSGADVGLPAGQMGNSEVGHMNLGAGRVIHQDFTRITGAIEDGSFFRNPVLLSAMDKLAENGGALHLLGLVSPGGVHSHEDHIAAAIDLARQQGVGPVYLHAFLDGRDTPPKSAEPSLAGLQRHIEEGGQGGIASIVGRYFAMDRDNRWSRLHTAWRLIVDSEAAFTAATPMEALQAAYARDETDEFVQATAIHGTGGPVVMENGDAVVFMNFRADRARQLTRAFVQSDFDSFERRRMPRLSKFVTLTEYAADMGAPCAFTSESVSNSLGEYISNLGKSQLRIAETEKYAHVTFFFSGGREESFPGEDRLLIPSPKVATYDLQPEMSAREVTDTLVAAITSGPYELIVCNYANGDMVGHTGNFPAAVKAVECIDESLGRIIDALEESGGQCLVTADHGNVEQLLDKGANQPHTAHTSGPVPLVYVGPQDIEFMQSSGVLSDVSPTLLALMGLPQPDAMTGRPLFAAGSLNAASN